MQARVEPLKPDGKKRFKEAADQLSKDIDGLV